MSKLVNLMSKKEIKKELKEIDSSYKSEFVKFVRKEQLEKELKKRK